MATGRLWLVIDVPCLAYRAFFTTGGLSHGGSPTGATYGVLRDILAFQTQFATSYMVFAFEGGRLKRKEIYPEYKSDRRRYLTAEEQQKRIELWEELKALRERYLPGIGFANVFSQEGYESDDVIAETVLNGLPPGDRALIVSTDSDLWQLLGPRVRQYNPTKKEVISAKTFREAWGIEPGMWINVKAMAGCASDNVQGIKGIGDKLASYYLAGTLSTQSKAYAKIVQGLEIWRRNLPLIELPYEGVKTPVLSSKLPTAAGWKKVLAQLGIKSLG